MGFRRQPRWCCSPLAGRSTFLPVSAGRSAASLQASLSPLEVSIVVLNAAHASNVTASFYDRATYDQSHDDTWAGAATIPLGPKNPPLSLTVTPWSLTIMQLRCEVIGIRHARRAVHDGESRHLTIYAALICTTREGLHENGWTAMFV